MNGYGESSTWWHETWEMVECCGCEEVKLQRRSLSSQDDSREGERVSYFPAAVSRRLPNWSAKLPYEVRDLLNEVYAAIHAGSCRLATVGARTLIDITMLDNKVGDVGSFKDKLAAMEQKGFLGVKNREFLEVAIDAGNAAAHRGLRLPPDKLFLVMDIVENMLQTSHVLEAAGQELRTEIPPRRQ